jgi:hypothetical protein
MALSQKSCQDMPQPVADCTHTAPQTREACRDVFRIQIARYLGIANGVELLLVRQGAGQVLQDVRAPLSM